MIKISALTALDGLKSLKAEYLAGTTAPLDGMWLCGFVPMGSHFTFHKNSVLIGYCCINDEGHLLQFHMRKSSQAQATPLLTSILAGTYSQLPEIKGAFVSTAEPEFLSHCFDHFASFTVNALMYQFEKGAPWPDKNENGWALERVESEHFSQTLEYGVDNLGAPEAWLTQYWSNLIQRGELFACWQDDEIIATGERRIFEEVQAGYADVGVLVSQRHRGQGLATWILRRLVEMTIEEGLKPMCSTERDNIGAQKAIARAGFVSRNRIIRFTA